MRCLERDVAPRLSGMERGKIRAVFEGCIVYHNAYDNELNARPYSAFSVDELVSLCEWIAINFKRTYTIPRAETLEYILSDIGCDSLGD